ncbi:hypothetical protein ACFQ9X_38095 [Catenulispora yoronensis]
MVNEAEDSLAEAGDSLPEAPADVIVPAIAAMSVPASRKARWFPRRRLGVVGVTMITAMGIVGMAADWTAYGGTPGTSRTPLPSAPGAGAAGLVRSEPAAPLTSSPTTTPQPGGAPIPAKVLEQPANRSPSPKPKPKPTTPTPKCLTGHGKGHAKCEPAAPREKIDHK